MRNRNSGRSLTAGNSDKGEQDDVFYDLLRLAMPAQLVNWGGHSMTFDAAVKKYFRDGSPA